MERGGSTVPPTVGTNQSTVNPPAPATSNCHSPHFPVVGHSDPCWHASFRIVAALHPNRWRHQWWRGPPAPPWPTSHRAAPWLHHAQSTSRAVRLISGLFVDCAYLVTGQYKNRFPTLNWGTSVRLGRKECVEKNNSGFEPGARNVLFYLTKPPRHHDFLDSQVFPSRPQNTSL